jgi:hypothetical protein
MCNVGVIFPVGNPIKKNEKNVKLQAFTHGHPEFHPSGGTPD